MGFQMERGPALAPILFRLQGEEVWELGAVEDLSGTGVLFRTRSWLPTETPLEVKLLVPGSGVNGLPLRMFCRAEVLRARWGAGPEVRIAARFSTFQFFPTVNPLHARPFPAPPEAEGTGTRAGASFPV